MPSHVVHQLFHFGVLLRQSSWGVILLCHNSPSIFFICAHPCSTTLYNQTSIPTAICFSFILGCATSSEAITKQKRRQKNSTALMRNMKSQKRFSDQPPCVIKSVKCIIIRSDRCRYRPMTPMFTLTRTPKSCICQANAPASRMHPKFTELLTITPKCLISKGNIFLTARGFTSCGMVVAFRGCHKAIKYISAAVVEILPPGKQTVSFIDSQDGYLNGGILICDEKAIIR